MKPKTERLLYLMLWTAESLAHPTWRNVTGSFEGWAYRNGLLRQLARLEREKFLEQRGEALTTVHRLTKKGRMRALGGRDPVERWKRAWDGKWRFALFDVSERDSSVRRALRRFLKANGFGCLQKSVWISPDPVDPFVRGLRGFEANAKAFACFEGVPCTHADDRQIAAQAWDFETLQVRHRECLGVLRRRPTDLSDESDADNLLKWAEEERLAWVEAMHLDPLLPRSLWPKGYLGEKVWRARARVLAQAGHAIANFQHPKPLGPVTK